MSDQPVEEAKRRLRLAVHWVGLRAKGQTGRLRKLHESLAWTAMSRATLRRTQLEHLKRVLSHAGATVPYYRGIFRDAGFDPARIESVEELRALPMLTKSTIREQGKRLLSSSVDNRQLKERTTGGSTGEPLRFFVTAAEYEEQMGTCLRANALVGILPGDPMAKVWGYGADLKAANALSPITGRVYLDAFHCNAEDLDRWARLLSRAPPKLIYGYPSAIHQLAVHLRDTGRQIPSVMVVGTTAETLFDAQRADIERYLGGKCIDMYGCHEIPRLASECLRGQMHLAPDAAVVEFLPIDDFDNGSCRLIVTSLSSYAMPLIRYDLGDIGRPLADAEPCACGLSFDRMLLDVGKSHHIFALPGGRRVNSVRLHKPICAVRGIAQFQVRHERLDRIAIHYVPCADKRQEAGALLEKALAPIRHQLGSSVQVGTLAVDALAKTPRGKQLAIVSLVAADGQLQPSR